MDSTRVGCRGPWRGRQGTQGGKQNERWGWCDKEARVSTMRLTKSPKTNTRQGTHTKRRKLAWARSCQVGREDEEEEEQGKHHAIDALASSTRAGISVSKNEILSAIASVDPFRAKQPVGAVKRRRGWYER